MSVPAFVYVNNLAAVAFLFVPPPPSSIKNKSASSIAAPISGAPSRSSADIAVPPVTKPKYVFKNEALTCFITPPSFITNLSASTTVTVEPLVSPSIIFSSVAVASTAASFVKSACTSPDTPSSKFNSAAVDVTAVLPKVNFPSGTISPAAPPSIKSSALASHCINAEAASPKNFTSYPVSSTPTVTVPSTCTAPSISTASKFVVPATSIAPLISRVAASSSPDIVKLRTPV